MTTHFLRFASGLLMLMFSLTLSGQNTLPLQTIRGQVTEVSTGLPVPGVSVVVKGSDPVLGTTSDAGGNYKIEGVTVGRVTIEYSCMGFRKVTISNVLLNSAKELILNVKLEEEVISLGDIEVSALSRKDKPVNEMAVISARSFNTEEADRYAGSMGDPARMAANFAGVSTSSDQRNDIVIRGNSPQFLLWRIEGVDIPNPNHFAAFGTTGGAISILNNNVLTQSDFYTGAFPASYGNALSGAFDLNMRNGNNEKHEFTGQVGFNGFELDAEGPFSKSSKASYLIALRYSTMDIIHALGFNFGTGNAIPKYTDGSFKINIPLKNYGRLTVFGLGGISYIELLDSKGDSADYGLSGSDLRFGCKMGVAGINHMYYFKNQGKLFTSLNVSGVTNSTEYTDLSYHLTVPQVIENLGETKYSLSSNYSRKTGSRNFFRTGVVFDLFDINYKGKAYDTISNDYIRYIDAKGNPLLLRSFAEWQHKFNGYLTLTTGLHGMCFPLNQSYSVEPRASLQWAFHERHRLSAGFGMHSQTQLKAVHYLKEQVSGSAAVFETTNKNLGFSKSIHFVLGYDYLPGNNHRIKTEIYYQYIYNVPVTELNPQYSFLVTGGDYGYQVYRSMVNKGTGENYGIELTVEKFISKGFYYLITASLFDAAYKGYDGVKRNSRFNNNYVFNLLAGYEIPLRNAGALLFDIKTVYAGGQRYVPIDSAASAAANNAVYDWEHAFEKRYNDYFRINVRAGFRKNGRKTNQEWGVEIQNLTNHKNVFMENWNNTKKEVVTSYQMGMIPMAMYRIYF